MKRKIYHGFAVDNGVDPVALMNARKDMKFQVWLRFGIALRICDA